MRGHGEKTPMPKKNKVLSGKKEYVSKFLGISDQTHRGCIIHPGLSGRENLQVTRGDETVHVSLRFRLMRFAAKTAKVTR